MNIHDTTVPLKNPDETTTLLEAALAYAAKGWYVVPLHHVTNGRCSCAKGPACGKDAGKHPHLEDWTNQCSIDPVLIQRWWQQWPHSGVGIVTGERSRLAVLDLDPRNGGDLALEDLEHAYRPLPDTPLVLTGGNGRHYYFALDGPLAKFDPGPGLNLQADGAQVVAPPSIHQSGTPYQWEASSGPDDVPLAPVPDWLRALGAASASAPVEGVELPPTLPCVEIATLNVSHRVKYVIQTGEDPDDPTRYCYPNGTPDRSRVLFAVLQALHAGGHDDATLASVVMDQRYAISEKVLSQKNARNPRYWEQTKGWVAREIARAKAKAQPRPTVPDMTPRNGTTPAEAPEEKPHDPRPVIRLGPDITRLVDEGEAALLALPEAPILFQRARRLSIIARGVPPPRWLHRPAEAPIIVEGQARYLDELATQAARWEKFDKRAKKGEEWQEVLPPARFVETLQARPSWPFPLLEGIIQSPTLRPDGSILDTPGYDVDTGLFFDSNGTVFPALCQRVTLDQARSAIGRLQEVTKNFLWATERRDFSAWLSAVCSVVCRYTIMGCVPLFGITATTRGSGKSLLADTIALIGTGHTAARWSQVCDLDEERKRLLSLALDGDPLVCIDNITVPLGSGALAAALTGSTIKDRLLGANQTKEAPISAVFLCTGNNVQYVGDVARRVVPIALDPKMERPEERTDFAHTPLLPWVQRERPRLTMAALTLIKAYFDAGCPAQGLTPFGSFEPWSDLIRQALVWLGEADPCEGRKEIEASSNPDFERLAVVLDAWQACYGTQPATLAKVADDIHKLAQHIGPETTRNSWNDLQDALGACDRRFDGKRLDTTRLGYAFRQWQGRVIDSKRLVSPGKGHGNKTEWKIDAL